MTMLKMKDIEALVKPQNSNLILTIPMFTVLLPAFLAFPMDVLTHLVIAH